MHKIVSLLLAVALCLGGAACGKKKQPKSGNAKQKTAARAQAIQQYETLVKSYPDSEYTPKAKERLQALKPPKK